MQTTLGDGTTTWLLLDSETVHGSGVVAPRLAFRITARTPRERMTVQLHLLRGELIASHERLGHGILTGIELSHGERQLTMEIPIDQISLEYLDRSASGNQIDVILRLSGWLHVRDDNTDGPHFASAPQPGEWVFQGVGEARQTDLHFRVARSDWFTQVLEPVGTVDYICTEILVPRADHPLRRSASHLGEAERALREGHDPQVFSLCRAAVEALPGALQHVYDGLQDPRERGALNDLLREASNYFHVGRHTADEGPLQGDFMVDHGDAAFALNLAKLLIAHTARVLDRPPR